MSKLESWLTGRAKSRRELVLKNRLRGIAARFPVTMVVVDLAAELQKIYDSEINIRIGWLWDGGIEVRLGDEVNGFLAEESVGSIADIVPWLQEAIAHFFPTSSYTASISSEVRERATNRLFLPPKIGSSVICPRVRRTSYRTRRHGCAFPVLLRPLRERRRGEAAEDSIALSGAYRRNPLEMADA